MENIKYELIRSRRRTVRIEINEAGVPVLRVPLRTTLKQAQELIERNRGWIEKHVAIVKARQEEAAKLPPLTPEDIRQLADKALEYIPPRVKYYAGILGVTYGRITIRNQKTKWGSCSVKGNLNFNCLLMLTPPEVIDAIIVHELCHRLEMNHSARFYAHVLRVYPEYRRWNKWLKEHGSEIMMRCHK